MSDVDDENSIAINDARLINFTVKTREDIVNKLLLEGKLPEDKSDKVMLMAALDGIDRNVLARAKIKADTKVADSNAQATSLIAAVLGAVSTKNVKVLDSNHSIPVLTIDVETVFVDGEKDTGTQHETFDNFMLKFPTEIDE